MTDILRPGWDEAEFLGPQANHPDERWSHLPAWGNTGKDDPFDPDALLRAIDLWDNYPEWALDTRIMHCWAAGMTDARLQLVGGKDVSPRILASLRDRLESKSPKQARLQEEFSDILDF